SVSLTVVRPSAPVAARRSATRRDIPSFPTRRSSDLIALNMKRWRHLPAELGNRYVMVNMADYRLQMINGNSVELDMKVIIGNLQRRTPVMAQTISTLELAPTWSVPKRLDRKSTRLNSSHVKLSYAVFCLKKKS